MESRGEQSRGEEMRGEERKESYVECEDAEQRKEEEGVLCGM